MLSLIPLFALSLGFAYVLAIVKMTAAAWEAPIGYEDGDGFHFGLAPSGSRPAMVRVDC